MGWWRSVGCDSFGDETYGDVKTSGDNVRGCILWGRNARGQNVRGRNVRGRIVSVPKKGFKHKTSLLTPFIGQHPPPSLMATSVWNQSCLCHYALWLQEMVAAIEQTCAQVRISTKILYSTMFGRDEITYSRLLTLLIMPLNEGKYVVRWSHPWPNKSCDVCNHNTTTKNRKIWYVWPWTCLF